MRRLLVIVGCVVAVACADGSVAPRPYTLGSGCWARLPLRDSTGKTVATLAVHVSDCTTLNRDSLEQLGWHIAPDTIYGSHAASVMR